MAVLERKSSIGPEEVEMLPAEKPDVQTEVKVVPVRESWSSKVDFILSCIGYCIGLGNIWRFPYLCYKNGGGAFLIPYVSVVLLCGIPMYFLELAVGQYYSAGILGVWRSTPGWKGIGLACLVINGWSNLYYPLVMAWALWYLLHSFRSVLPWSTCDNHWNTINCIEISTLIQPCRNSSNISSELPSNLSITGSTCNITNFDMGDNSTHRVSAETEFWNRHTIRMSDSIEDTGEFHWQMALLLLFVWILCYLCIWKGVKLSGKIVYVTAVLPYILIFVLLVRGATLPGARDGIRFYLYPQLHRLADSQVWVDAASQVFYSTGVGYCAVVVLGSYNGFHQDVFKTAVLVSSVNALTSLTAGFAIFSVLGYLAHILGKSVADVAESGPGLAFIVYPSALTLLPGAAFWSFLFFLMLVLVGLDTQFCMLEGFFTSIIDEFPSVLRKRRELFIGICGFLWFLVGLSMTTQSGVYVFHLLDWYAGSRIALIVIVFFESITVGWLVGGEGFYSRIEEMIGYRPSPIFRVCWRFIIPVICFSIFIFSLVKYSPVSYQETVYPKWAEVIGWVFTLSSILGIPLVAIATVIRGKGSWKERMHTTLLSSNDEKTIPG